MNVKSIIRIITALLFLAPSFIGITPGLVQAAAAASAFGYNWTLTSDPNQWIEINATSTTPGELLSFVDEFGRPAYDDGLSTEAQPLGFEFPYFEYRYSGVWISTNGFLLFGDSPYNRSDNVPIPQDLLPNNLVAPFWDDLAVGGTFNNGKVFTRAFDGTHPYFVIEWDQVSQLGSGSLSLSFEVVLYANGDIRFNYKTLNGILDENTIGIEDSDGVDGIQVHFNETGLAEGQTMLFTYPAGGPRLKVSPRYASNFLINHTAEMLFNLRNTGTTAEVIGFKSDYMSGRGNIWELRFFTNNGQPLEDSDGDGYADTGDQPLQPLEVRQVRVLLTAPDLPAVGDYNCWQVEYFATSDPTQKFIIELQAAVPAPFAQGIYDQGRGLTVLRFSASERSTAGVGGAYSLSGLTLATLSPTRIMAGWQHSNSLMRGVINYSSWGIGAAANIRNAPHFPYFTLDSEPVIAALQDGSQAALFYLTSEEDSSNIYDPGSRTNLRLALFTPAGATLSDQAITTNTLFRYKSSINVPSHSALRIAALDSSCYLLTWNEDKQITANVSVRDVYYAIYGSDGSQILPPTQLTFSKAGITQFFSPVPTAINGGKALLAYTLFTTDVGSELRYVLVNSATGTASPEFPALAANNGTTLDGTQLLGGALLLAWTDVPSGRIAYAMLDGDGKVMQPSQLLASPNGRTMEYVSVAQAGDEAVLTWGDKPGEEYTYYALIGNDGSLITPPMTFYHGSDPLSHNLFISVNGNGNTSYSDTSNVPRFVLYLPTGLQNP